MKNLIFKSSFGIFLLLLYSCSLPSTQLKEEAVQELRNNIQSYVQTLEIENIVESEFLEKYNQFKKEYQTISGGDASKKSSLSDPEIVTIDNFIDKEIIGSSYSEQRTNYNALFEKEEYLFNVMADAKHIFLIHPFDWRLYISFIRSYIMYASFKNNNPDLTVVRFADGYDGIPAMPKPLIGLNFEDLSDKYVYVKIYNAYTKISHRGPFQYFVDEDLGYLDKIKTMKYILDGVSKKLLALIFTYQTYSVREGKYGYDATAILIADGPKPEDFLFSYYVYTYPNDKTKSLLLTQENLTLKN